MPGKIRSFIFACILFVCNQAVAQQMPYYDALALAGTLNEDDFFTLDSSANSSLSILAKYYDGRNKQLGVRAFRDYFQKNDFLKSFFPQGGSAGISTFDLSGVKPAKFSPAGIGGLNVVNVADGLAKFLVDRTKAEISLAFFREFKDELTKEENEPFGLLFPQTYATLVVVDEDIYNYPRYLQSLQSAYRKDLGNLFPNVSRLLNLPKYDAFFKGDIVRSLVRQSMVPAQMFVTGEHPAVILNHLARVDFKHNKLTNLEGSFKLLNLFSQSLIARDSTRGQWISISDLDALLTMKHALDIYAGLLFQQAGGLTFDRIGGGKVSFQQILKGFRDANNGLRSLGVRLERFVSRANSIDETIGGNALAPGITMKSSPNYFSMSQSVLDLVREGSEFVRDNNLATEKDTLFLQSMAYANELALDARQKNYGSAVINMVGLLYNALDEKKFKLPKAKVLKYGSFMAAVAKAETADDIQKAIEAIALPVGSSSHKKLAKFNISLNTYVGGFYGTEKLDDLAELSDADVFGVWAPLGIAFSWGLSKLDHGSLSLFATLIDIGAVTAFRFQDETESLPEIQLKNIFAPGFYLNYGLPKVPLTIGAGLQWGPNLRKITKETLSVTGTNGYRISVVAAVDIPILNFYTAARN